ncbi:hypothetical protein [Phenylobacterium sp.]|uniref:hypothetical protein n=1 Tax=Phenylobacterium sp. TaxID=1871053 RepID=UPI0025EF8862|nr:hypothetical protein [Phenylobacterium sp.]MBX3485120.1 hypothetical protein [Phenylobacterium sp.]
MSFTTLPAWAVAAGAVTFAALLYLLQHLKTRQRVVRLPAAQLWVQAARDMPPKALWDRFRDWLAYLFILVIALVLWVAGAQPEIQVGRANQRQIFYLDASAAMMGDDAFDRAKRALIADVRATPAEQREVYLGDGGGTRLLSPGENVALLIRRLSGVAAAARPSEFEAWALAHVAKPPTALRYYGAWAAAKDLAARRPDGVLLSYGYLAPPTPGNRGVVNLGVTPAASGDWTRADVQVEAVAADGRTIGAGDLRFSRNGTVLAPTVLPLGRGRFRLDGLEADGRLLTVTLKAGDGFPADDTASIRLPDHRPIRVSLSPGVPSTIRDIVRLDTAFQITPVEKAEVVMGREGESLRVDKPAFVLTPRQEGATFAFTVTHPEEEARVHLPSGLARLGLGEADAEGLADRLVRPVSVDVAVGPRRFVSVWSSIFDQDADFAKSANLPLFVSQSLRWLADRDPWIAYAQAGARLSDQSGLYGLGEDRRIAARALNGEVRVGAAGVEDFDGLPLAVSLTDRRQTLAAAEPPPPDAVRRIERRGLPDLMFRLLVLAAAGLLLVEWRAFLRGAIT